MPIQKLKSKFYKTFFKRNLYFGLLHFPPFLEHCCLKLKHKTEICFTKCESLQDQVFYIPSSSTWEEIRFFILDNPPRTSTFLKVKD